MSARHRGSVASKWGLQLRSILNFRSSVLSLGLWSAAYVSAVVWLASPTLAELHELWTDTLTYSHGYLAVLLTVWLMIRAYRVQQPTCRIPSLLGVVALSICVLSVLVGRASHTSIIPQLLLPMLGLSAFWAVAGFRNATQFFLPASYLYFVIPIWDFLTEPLRSLTTTVVAVFARASGIPAYIEGNFIRIPSGTFEVAGGCSGLHFLVVGLALATFYALRYYPGWRARITLVLMAGVLALASNWIRVFALVVLGHVTEMQHYFVSVDHYYFGWAVFTVVIAPMFFAARWLERPRSPSPTRAVAPRNARSLPARGVVAASAFVVLVAGGWLGQRLEVTAAMGMAIEVPAVSLPALGGWQPAGEWVDSRRPSYQGAGAEEAAWYRSREGIVGLYLAQYAVQAQGQELVYYANRPQGAATRVLRRNPRYFDVAPAGALPIVELEVMDSSEHRRLVWYTMRVAGWPTSNEIAAKLYQAAGVMNGRSDAQVAVFTSACDVECGPARKLLEDFVRQAAIPLFECAEPTSLARTDGAAFNEMEICDGA